jgi:uncharacterized ion transporter superfamily protein YfcC
MSDESVRWPRCYERAVATVGVLVVALVASVMRPGVANLAWWEQGIAAVGVLYIVGFSVYLTADYIADTFAEQAEKGERA